jgi:hypothetical protein
MPESAQKVFDDVLPSTLNSIDCIGTFEISIP